MIPSDRLIQLLAEFRSRRILVIGDLMLDEFIWGKVTRISPEAPVPVVEVSHESCYAGGAANVARNLRAFCDDVYLMGLTGGDQGGEKLRKLLSDDQIHLEGVLEDEARPTSVKTRIIAQHQQVVRVDREKCVPVEARCRAELEARLTTLLPEVDGVIFEDYGKGFFTQELSDRMIELASPSNRVLTADPNPRNLLKWRGCHTIKPNRTEAFAAAGIPLSAPIHPVHDDAQLLEVGTRLLKLWEAECVLITLGEQGMVLFHHDGKHHHTPTRAREVFDVSGAGDTAIALYTLALCAGATPVEAAEISNHASGVVVGKLGTATLTREELHASFLTDPA